jgi:tetratricopeptide (TPR) repeat protein
MPDTHIDRRFELKSPLGRSDLGTTSLATDTATGEMVALKRFAEPVDLRAEEGLRFRLMVERLRGFHHPHLIVPAEAGIFANTGYQVSAYFPADPLPMVMGAALGAAIPLSLADLVTVLRQLAEGLGALHLQGYVHGNLRPENVLVSREDGHVHAVATDPGLTPLRGIETSLLHERLGHWHSPEEAPWLERLPDARSDLYLLGTLAYWMLAGRLPFAGASPADLIGLRLSGQPPLVREWNAHVPQRLSAVVAGLLARHPDERYQSAEGLLHDLRSWSHPEPGLLGEADRPLTAFVRARTAGRESAREAALSTLARARMGEGGLVIWEGEPGSGKRTLLESLRWTCEASGALVLRAETPREGWCPPFHVPLALLQDLLRRWALLPDLRRRDLLYGLHQRVGRHAALLTELLPELGTLFPEPEPPPPIPAERARARTLNALCEAFLALASREHVLVLALADLHRADADSLDWLRFLAHRLEGQPALVLAGLSATSAWNESPASAWLRGERRHDGWHWVALPPLTAAQTLSSLRQGSHLGPDDPLLPALAQWLHGRWGGQPLAQELALRALWERELLQPDVAQADKTQPRWSPEHPASRELPGTLGGLIEHVLQALPGALYATLEPASVLPGTFPLESLSAVLPDLPLEALVERLDALTATGLLKRGSRGWRFSHERVREAVVQRIPPRRRAPWHQAAAAFLEGTAAAPPLWRWHAVTRHFAHSEELERAAQAGLTLAEAARQMNAARAACAEYESLLAAVRGDPRAGLLYAALGECRAWLGEEHAARLALNEALLRTADPARQAETLGALALNAWLAGRRDDARAHLEEALQCLGETLPHNPVGTALARLATGAATRYQQMLASVGGALQPLPSPAEHLLSRLLEMAALILAGSQPGRAALADERILNLAVGRLPSTYAVRALIRLGERDPAGGALSQAAQIAGQRHYPQEAASARLAGARGLAARIDTAAAREAFAAARRDFQSLGDPWGELEALHDGLWLMAWQGPAPAIAETARQMQSLADMLDAEPWKLLSEAWLAAGEAQEGKRAASQAIALLARHGEALAATALASKSRVLRRLLAELQLATDQPRQALATGREPTSGGTLEDLLWNATQAEAQFCAARNAPGPATHLREGRRLLRSLKAEEARVPALSVLLCRAAVLERFADGNEASALALAEESERWLKDQDLRVPLGCLQFRVAEGLKANGSEAWLQWGGKALTLFDALGAEPWRQATRRLLELDAAVPAPPEDEPSLAAPRGTWSDSLLALLEPFTSGTGPAPDALARSLLRVFMDASDAERGLMFLPDGMGEPELRASIPTQPGAPGWLNNWLLEQSWRSGQVMFLDHYQPSEPGMEAWDAQSLLCVPLGGPRGLGAVYLASTVSRHVFRDSERVRAGEMARQAAALLGIAASQERLRRSSETEYRDAQRWRRWSEWGLRVSEFPAASGMLRALLEEIAAPLGFSALAAYGRLESEARLTCFANWRENQAGPPERLPGIDTLADFPALRTTIEQQRPTAFRLDPAATSSAGESAVLGILAGNWGLWLPWIVKGDSLGALLLARPEPLADPDGSAEQELITALRLIAPSLHAAWLRENLNAARSGTERSVHSMERTLAFARRLLPEGLQPCLDPGQANEAPEAVRIPEAVVVAGKVLGWERHGASASAADLGTLRQYLEQVSEALALHHGRIERIGEGWWLARIRGAPESALWAAESVQALLSAWEAEPEREGEARLRTGLGVHLGAWVEWLAAAGERRDPLVLGNASGLALRLAERNFHFHTDVLVSDQVVQALAEAARFSLRPLGSLRLEPGAPRIKCHELFSTREPARREGMTARSGLWNRALAHYRAGEWMEAEVQLRDYLRDLPDDRPARLFLRACLRRVN